MKNLFKLLIYSLLLVSSPAVLSSCSEDSGDIPVDKPVVVSVEASHNLELSQDLLNLADITVEFNDINGNPVTKKVTTLKWKDSYHITNFPFSTPFKFNVKIKEGVSLDKEKYTITAIYRFTANANLSNGEQALMGIQSPIPQLSGSITGIMADHVIDAIMSRNGRSCTCKIVKSADGYYMQTE